MDTVSAGQQAGWRVLIISGRAEERAALTDYFARQGLEVEAVGTVAEALASAARSAGEVLALLDAGVAGGRELALVRQLHEVSPHLHVVLLPGGPDCTEVGGIEGALTGPVEEDSLSVAMARLRVH